MNPTSLLTVHLPEPEDRPFPVPSEALQYRAIGLIRGRYTPEEEHLTKGLLETTDGTVIDAVLLGRVLSLVKKHLDLNESQLWVVYPRTREVGGMHAQIVGVWSPDGQLKQTLLQPPIPPEIPESYFSVRGEVVFHSSELNYFLIKIRQQKKKRKPGKAFKLRIEGLLPENARNKFWDIEVTRHENTLVMHTGRFVAPVPKAVGRKSLRRPGSTGNERSDRPARPPLERRPEDGAPLPRPSRKVIG